MRQTVAIDCLRRLTRFRRGYAIAVVDVVRATTSAVTAVAGGRRCFVARSVPAAFRLAGTLEHPLLAGEVAGVMPSGFDLNNSPAELAIADDLSRSLVLLSSSCTKLICEAGRCDSACIACFRNWAATASYLAQLDSRVAVVGAETRAEFREEDRICCAWITAELMKSGYEAEDRKTEDIVERWSSASSEAWLDGKSAAYLRRSGQLNDLEFIVTRVNDLDTVFRVVANEIVRTAVRQMESRSYPSALRITYPAACHLMRARRTGVFREPVSKIG
jgi:2-phosphosulfolactate phosphatase